MQSLLLATGNPSKVREISTAIADLNFAIISLAKFKNHFDEPAEDGDTFEENARIKSEFWREKTELPTLSDDSGILVEALPEELGVRTVRFGAGKKASDKEWLDYFLKRMHKQKNRRAQFISVIAISVPNSETYFFRGEVHGEILEKPAAPLLPRIPLSSVFLASGASKVFAAMNTTEKERFSHRGRALVAARKFLEKLSC